MTKPEVLSAGMRHKHKMILVLKRNGLWVCERPDCSRRELRPTKWRKDA